MYQTTGRTKRISGLETWTKVSDVTLRCKLLLCRSWRSVLVEVRREDAPPPPSHEIDHFYGLLQVYFVFVVTHTMHALTGFFLLCALN